MKNGTSWVFCKGAFVDTSKFNSNLPNSTNSVYEVIRIVDYIPLFLNDHFIRLESAIQSLSLQFSLSNSELKDIILELVSRNSIKEGNIKVEVLSDAKWNLNIFQIEHFYPGSELYRNGIKLLSYSIERKNPHVKQSIINTIVRNTIKQLQEIPDIYEILLINDNKEITEGSRSNIFLIRDNKLFSPPSKDILEGITRKIVISIASSLGIVFNESVIPYSELSGFQACFITGTSPKILPVRQIDTILFDPKHSLCKRLMLAYDKSISDYYRNFK